MKWLRPVLLASVLACSHSYAGSTPETLTLALGAEPESGFDPLLGWGKYNNPLFQSRLIERDNKLALTPGLAQSWQTGADGLQWHIHLKPGLKFSDGSILNAEDIKFTFEHAARSPSAQDLTMLEWVEVIDPLHLIFHLKRPDVTFIEPLTTLGIVPSDRYAKGYGANPIGSGPYKLVRWDRGQQLVVERNPLYAGQRPEFDRLVLLFGNDDSRFTQLQAGQLDMAAVVPRYAFHIPGGFRLWQVPSVDNRGVVWPMDKPSPEHPNRGNWVSSDKAIRDAVSLAADRTMLVHGLLDGFARPAWSIADDLPWGTTHREVNQSHAQDMAQANSLLDKASWELKDGVRTKIIDGKPVAARMTLNYAAGDSTREQLSLALAQMVKPLGIILTPKAGSWEEIARVMHQQPVLMGFGSHSASEVYFTHHSRYGGVEYYNSGFYHNVRVDELLDNARQSSSWESSLPLWQQAQTEIAKDQPWTWLVNLTHLYAVRACLNLGEPGIEPHGHGWPILNNVTQWHWTCQ
ncbi:ABC transporter substrate-binding protein [Shewanella submarina]|uniref:ABC transporter substrate-binding protein n=1 Tax=Shewanella submarina TaxID=2016376 RepID=A0ABV7GFG0_9GAMM|nr:ABC transporter substrate-binding protein [Shewanella submarina]MCL1039205.1 ABC transporter substrate-binding protein [Shewanella submarina]